MHSRIISLILSFALVTGCESAEPRARVQYSPRVNLPAQSWHLTIDDGDRAHSFQWDNLTIGSLAATPDLATASSGTLRITFQLRSAGMIMSEGDVSLDLRGDWEWGVDVRIDSLNPQLQCFGCLGARSFPVAVAARRIAKDSMWVTWGGNSIKNPVVY
ncbi:MAG: hypothetical protein JWM95_4437 [Gemmatimonadetes bacterium]|nr:hypothetical protein [Gemmatimonadota bacterium]